LEFNGNKIEVLMYIDSGADITLIPFTSGKALRLQERANDDILIRKEDNKIAGITILKAVK